AEPRQELGGVALGGVAVLLGDGALELAEPRPFVVGELRAREQLLLLVHRGPELLVAHDDDGENFVLFEGELILLQDRRFLGTRHRPGVPVELPGEDLEERRLAGAVRAGEPVAAALAEVDRHVFEQTLRTVGFRYTDDLYRRHGSTLLKLV